MKTNGPDIYHTLSPEMRRHYGRSGSRVTWTLLLIILAVVGGVAGWWYGTGSLPGLPWPPLSTEQAPAVQRPSEPLSPVAPMEQSVPSPATAVDSTAPLPAPAPARAPEGAAAAVPVAPSSDAPPADAPVPTPDAKPITEDEKKAGAAALPVVENSTVQVESEAPEAVSSPGSPTKPVEEVIQVPVQPQASAVTEDAPETVAVSPAPVAPTRTSASPSIGISAAAAPQPGGMGGEEEALHRQLKIKDYLRQADLLYQQGEFAAAVSVLDKIVRQYPDSEDAVEVAALIREIKQTMEEKKQ